jgi:hypothetical protein
MIINFIAMRQNLPPAAASRNPWNQKQFWRFALRRVAVGDDQWTKYSSARRRPPSGSFSSSRSIPSKSRAKA